MMFKLRCYRHRGKRGTVFVKQINLYLYQSAKKMNFAGPSFVGKDVPNISSGMINELTVHVIIINYIRQN